MQHANAGRFMGQSEAREVCGLSGFGFVWGSHSEVLGSRNMCLSPLSSLPSLSDFIMEILQDKLLLETSHFNNSLLTHYNEFLFTELLNTVIWQA